MKITTLRELRVAVSDWINREDLSDDLLDQMVGMAEHRILTDDRSSFIPLDEEFSITLDASRQVSPYDGFGDKVVIAAAIDGKVLKPVSWETYQTARKEGANVDQDIWTTVQGRFYYPGWPLATDPIDLTRPDVELVLKTEKKDGLQFADPDATSQFLREHYEIYLYATLLEVATYLRDMEGVQLYQVRYDNIMDTTAKGYQRRKVANGFTVSSIGADFNFDRSY